MLKLTQRYVRKDVDDHAVLAARALAALHPDSAEARRARALIDAETAVDVPPTTDPLDLLMIANGRQREETTFGIPKVPAIDDDRGRSRFGGGAPGANCPRTDPFGRGSTF